jgi:AcrR family transcriptional regulator
MQKNKENRAVPQQERSQRRYDAILDAGAAVFAEHGVEAATMQEIAERAETSIGSVYRFFADKEALFQAVVDRVAANERELMETVFSSAFDEPLSKLIDRVVDVYAERNALEPGWYAIWNHLNLRQPTGEFDQGLRSEQLRRLQVLIRYYAPHLDTARGEIISTTIWWLLTGMLAAAQRQLSPMREHLLEETKRLLRSYGRDYLGTEEI